MMSWAMWGPCEEIFLFFFPSFIIILFLCPSFVCCDAFFFLLGSLVIVNQKSVLSNNFLSFFLSDREIQIPIPILSLSLSLSLSSLKKTPRQTPRPCLRSARDRSIESRFVTSHREIQTTLLRHRRERERKKWRTFCSHRGCARVRDGTRTGNPSIRPPP